MPPLETEGAALLDIAQRTLTEEVLPRLDGDARIAALMVASAMRMAAREIAQAENLLVARAALLDMAPGRAGDGDDSGAGERRAVEGLAGLAGLAAAIRQGACDADAGLHGLLWAEAAVRASISKPSALARAERIVASLDRAGPLPA